MVPGGLEQERVDGEKVVTAAFATDEQGAGQGVDIGAAGSVPVSRASWAITRCRSATVLSDRPWPLMAWAHVAVRSAGAVSGVTSVRIVVVLIAPGSPPPVVARASTHRTSGGDDAGGRGPAGPAVDADGL